MPMFIQVYNTAVHEQVRFEKLDVKTLEEALAYKAAVEDEYSQIGCHTVRLLMEVAPDEEDEDLEEEFDAEDVEE